MRLLICPFGGQIYLLQMSLGHLLVPGSTEVLKIMKKKNTNEDWPRLKAQEPT